MSKKMKSAKLFSELQSSFKCPICDQSIHVVDFKSTVCSNNHTFDFARQGYINFMTNYIKSNYSKDLFEARNKIIMESNLYNPLHQAIMEIIEEHADLFSQPLMIVDLGCGEGSHLQKIMNECRNRPLHGVGLDISKEGIKVAAKNYEKPLWIVGDLANSPFADHSFHVILNILSPANYDDFKRILMKNGLVIKVIPRTNYLKELREVLFSENDRNDYSNDRTISLFESHFQLVDIKSLSYTQILQKTELENLVQMTPLTWSANTSLIDTFVTQDSAKITVDLDILIGFNK